MIRRGTGDIDEVRRFAVEQQFEVLVHADMFDCAQSGLAARRDRFMDRDDFDLGPLAPSGKMALFGDLAKAGNCPAKFQGSSSSRVCENATSFYQFDPYP